MKILMYAWLYLVASFVAMLAVKVWARSTGRACRPLAAWFDIWVGFYWDTAKRRLYVFPVPMLGIWVDMVPRTLHSLRIPHAGVHVTCRVAGQAELLNVADACAALGARKIQGTGVRP